MATREADHPVHTDHPQWAAMEVGGDACARRRREEAGAGEAGAEAEEGVEVEGGTLVTGPARTRGRGAGPREGALRDHPTVVRLRGHRRVVEEEEARRPEEVGEEAVGGEALAMSPTTVRGQGVGVGAGAVTGDKGWRRINKTDGLYPVFSTVLGLPYTNIEILI